MNFPGFTFILTLNIEIRAIFFKINNLTISTCCDFIETRFVKLISASLFLILILPFLEQKIK